MKIKVNKFFSGTKIFGINITTHSQRRKALLDDTAVQEIAYMAYIEGTMDVWESNTRKNITQLTVHLKEIL